MAAPATLRGQCVKERECVFNELRSRLKAAVAELHESEKSLEHRLEPVMGPPHPTESADTPSNSGPGVSALTDMVSEMEMEILAAARNLASVRDRLTL